MDVRQDHIDVRATEQPELSIRLCHRAPWVWYKANQLHGDYSERGRSPLYGNDGTAHTDIKRRHC